MKKLYAVLIALISLLIVLPFGNVVSAATSSDGYVWPIDVSSARSVYTSDFFDAHPAIDIAASVGTPVVAAKGGSVFCASTASTSASHKCSRCGFTGAGYHVVIKQTDGKYAMYAHLSSVSVSTDASIATGKKIGAVGSTGISTGAHLHFGIYNPNSDGSINYYSYTEPLKVLTPFCNVYADNITNTSAVLHGQFGAISIPFASAGIYFGTSTDNMKKITDSEASGYEYAGNNVEGLFFDTATYCGQLEKGVTYYYQIWIVNSGKEYKSDIYRFTAGDTNSSAQVTDAVSYSLSWTDKISDVSETNATVGKICHLNGITNLSVSKVGIYLYDNDGNLLDSLTESTANAGFAGETAVHIWYDIYNELGYSLSSGTTYKYKLMVEINGNTHYSPVYTFTTDGCEHNFLYVGGSSATCTQSGESNYKCTKCNATKTETASPLGHSFSSTYYIDKEATCLEEGSKSLHCSRCTVKKSITAIPAKGHSWNNGVITTTPTCGKDGVRTYSCSSCTEAKTEAIQKTDAHTYDNACDTSCNVCGNTRTVSHSYQTTWSKDGSKHWHACSICGAKKDETSHTPGAAATETTAQTCTTCGYVIKAALGHTHSYSSTWEKDVSGHWHECSCGARKDEGTHAYDGGMVTKEPSVEKEGVKTYTCIACGATKTEAIAKLPPATSENQTTPENTTDGNTTVPDVSVPDVTDKTDDKSGNDKKNNATTVVIITAVASVLGGAGIASAVFAIISKKRR